MPHNEFWWFLFGMIVMFAILIILGIIFAKPALVIFLRGLKLDFLAKLLKG